MLRTFLAPLMRFIVLLLVFVIAICAFVVVWGAYTQLIILILKAIGISVEVMEFGKLLLVALFSFFLALITSVAAKKLTNRILSKHSK